MTVHKGKIILPGGAGLVGQNLVAHLKRQGYGEIVVIDKHGANLAILQKMHPDVITRCDDLSIPGDWQALLEHASAVVMLQAQIGGTDKNDFLRNNITSTENVLAACKQYHIPYIVHVSTSALKASVQDFYAETKQAQENLIAKSGIPHIILRPTLMFGWFDRKHLGWISRFMKKTPVFPIPGDGRYIRQPLYVQDFCNIIIKSLENRKSGAFNITGLERIAYIDIIRAIQRATQAKTLIVKIPYGIFYALLQLWRLFDSNPPFTPAQLQALVSGDEFDVIDWGSIFGVTPTPFEQAIAETFKDPVHSNIALES